MIPAEFDEIRPYNPEELPQIYEELIADPEFQAVMGYVFKDIPFEYVAAKMRACKTNLDFQVNMVLPFLQNVLEKLSGGLTSSIENITSSMAQFQL